MKSPAKSLEHSSGTATPAAMDPSVTSAPAPRWWRLYFALAAFDLVTISFSLWLNHRLMDTQQQTVALNQEWARRLGAYSDLARLSGDVNAPGNDVFDSKDVDAELARLVAAYAPFEDAMKAAEEDLARVPPAQREELAGRLQKAREAMVGMVEEANLIFSFFRAGQPERAGERMATMDRKFAAVTEAFADLNHDVREIQSTQFTSQQEHTRKLRRYEYLIAGAIIAMVLAVTFYGHRMARTMAAMMADKERYLNELHAAHAVLEQRVVERTAELRAEIARREQAQREAEETHVRLLEASRQAGMAEVATGVLHNVGNVLNSVNLSAGLLVERVRKSRAGHLARVTDLVREHRADLGRYLTEDPKGRMLPDYLVAIATELSAEQAALAQEAQGLQKNVEHIKQVVAMQQNYARVTAANEQLSLPDLMQDALRMSAAGLERHRVAVVREFSPVPAVFADRHAVLQILVNLLNNAKQALDSRAEDRCVVLRVASPDGQRVVVEVADNGTGIAPENLAKIFNHGFTTKKTGHGFGLHSGANAAKEMGGSLSVRSDGPGRGATFVLELPVVQPSAVAEKEAA